MYPKKIKNSFTERYLIAILLLIILSSSAFYILTAALKAYEPTPLIISLSGKQSMLSQRIALYSQQYYQSASDRKNTKQTKEIRILLRSAVEEMRVINEKVSSGQISVGKKIEHSYKIHTLYFGKNHLKNRVDDYLSLVNSLDRAKTRTATRAILNNIITSSNTLLPDLEAAVLQHQEEANTSITNIYALQFTVWILTLTTLLLEIIFIFRPMADKIGALLHKTVWNEHNLQEEVQIRTVSLIDSNEKLAQLASHDPLTGLKNRLYMEKDLLLLINLQHVHHSPYAVVMLDIDWFKNINDTYGHDAGDFVLCELAKIFHETIRPQDSIYRIGGEEFIVIFNRITLDQTVEKCEKIRLRVQDHQFIYHEFILEITISIGIYHPDKGTVDSVKEALKLADNALYQAKRMGRNKVVVADKILH